MKITRFNNNCCYETIVFLTLKIIRERDRAREREREREISMIAHIEYKVEKSLRFLTFSDEMLPDMKYKWLRKGKMFSILCNCLYSL
jgi:hypothetical protein